jgi:hypothetical protein
VSVDRDRILEQALKHELRANSDATPHLDAETLAAWQDESLDAAQMETIEQHVSTCARCQSLLAAFARGTAAVAPGTPAPETAAHGTIGTAGTAGTGSLWRWWLAPIAAGAVAVTIWMVVPEQQQRATAPPVPQDTVAVDKVQPPAVAAEKKAATEPTTSAAAAPAAPAAEPLEARARAADTEARENKLKADTARDDRGQQFKDQAAAAPKEEVALTQAAPAAPAARAEAGARIAALQKQDLGPAIAATPDGAVAWRIANGVLVRYDNNSAIGTELHRFTPDETITTGAAPNSTTLWLAGRAGVVLLSTNATTFTRVDLPQRVDIVRLDAAGSQSVTALTADGRQFRTEDGGRTWRLIPA